MNLNKLIRINIQFDVDSFKDYHQFIENYIQSKLIEAEEHFKMIQAEYNKLEPEEIDDVAFDYRSSITDEKRTEYQTIKREFATRYRNSLVIQLFSFFEDKLNAYCEYKALKPKSSAENRKYDDYKKLIKQSGKVDFSVHQPEWNFMENVKCLRNNIVHQGSTIGKSDKRFKPLFLFKEGNYSVVLKKTRIRGSKRKSIIQVPIEYDVILDDANFILKIISTIEAIFDKLYE